MRTAFLILFSILLSASSFAQTKEELKLEKKIRKAVISEILVSFQDSFKTNQPVDLTIIVKTKGTKQLFSNGIVNTLCFDIESPDASFNNKGQLVIKQNTKAQLTGEVFFKVIHKQNRSAVCDTSIKLNYQGLLTIDYSGKDGKDGVNGENMSNGNILLESNGSNGFSGEEGQTIDVFVKTGTDIEFGKELLFLKIVSRSDSSVKYYVTNPDKSEIIIKVNGGNGGNGGNGSDGLKGRTSTSRIISFDNNGNISGLSYGYPGGYGGNGGEGGCGGNCGKINVIFSPDAQKYKSILSLELMGGNGGKGGNPGRRGPYGDVIINGKKYKGNSTIGDYKPPPDYEKKGNDGFVGNCYMTPKISVEPVYFKIFE